MQHHRHRNTDICLNKPGQRQCDLEPCKLMIFLKSCFLKETSIGGWLCLRISRFLKRNAVVGFVLKINNGMMMVFLFIIIGSTVHNPVSTKKLNVFFLTILILFQRHNLALENNILHGISSSRLS